MKDKEITKKKLIEAVGKVIRESGFTYLKISRIAKVAEVDRKLIYRYFGKLDYLIEAYIVENDYWLLFAEEMKKMLAEKEFTGLEQLITEVLQNQFSFFATHEQMQRLILWELSARSPLMRSIHNTRENFGQEFLEMTDQHLKGRHVNFRAVAALLVGGIYYTILHTVNNGGTFTGIDLHTKEGKDQVQKAVGQIIHWAFQAESARP